MKKLSLKDFRKNKLNLINILGGNVEPIRYRKYNATGSGKISGRSYSSDLHIDTNRDGVNDAAIFYNECEEDRGGITE